MTTGASSRTKGAAAERELSNLLHEHLGDAVSRRLGAARDGGHDLDLAGCALEVKRQETLCLPAWWRQACDQAIRVSLPPVLAYRRSREPWRFRMPLSVVLGERWDPGPALDMTVEVGIEAFAVIWRERLRADGAHSVDDDADEGRC